MSCIWHDTPWAGAAKEHGKRTYMLAYHMLDYATAICPRYAVVVSRKLGHEAGGTEEKIMITVLMATYQGRQYLEQQLDTILAQTVPVKILISDDGSDDRNPGNVR